MSATDSDAACDLEAAWFTQLAFSTLFKTESNSQLNENKFDSSEMFIDAMSISEQSSKRFKSLRAINVDGQHLYPANHFQPADYFGQQFLSHAVYASLFDQHISRLQRVEKLDFNRCVLGEIQNRFYRNSMPEDFFYDAASWGSKKRQNQIEKFQIGRPKPRVCDFIFSEKKEVKRRILSGNSVPIFDSDFLEEADDPTQAALPLIEKKTERLIKRLDELLMGATDNKLAKDLLDFTRVLGVVLSCGNADVTSPGYQQFMIDWDSAPKPIQGATSLQATLWKWLFVSFPDDRDKYFHSKGDSNSVINKKTKARSRRLEGLNTLIGDFMARAQV